MGKKDTQDLKKLKDFGKILVKAKVKGIKNADQNVTQRA